uniref:Uncharacterized protein LOC111113578 n=1 Tax=Crassostrea virginica TaxID=6565 RepID=A0A8B8BXK1_CRAVI|nr:uncharacterized protein LOC111113578 [Crassostrea virginica]
MCYEKIQIPIHMSDDSGGHRSVSKRIISFSNENEHREVSMWTNKYFMQGNPGTTLSIPRSGRYIVSAPLEKNKATCSPRMSRSVGYEEVSARMAVANQQVEVNSVYLKPELFHHFNYILNLARDCEPRVRNICKSMTANKLLYGNACIRIRYVGKMNDNVPVQKTMKDDRIQDREDLNPEEKAGLYGQQLARYRHYLEKARSEGRSLSLPPATPTTASESKIFPTPAGQPAGLAQFAQALKEVNTPNEFVQNPDVIKAMLVPSKISTPKSAVDDEDQDDTGFQDASS